MSSNMDETRDDIDLQLTLNKNGILEIYSSVERSKEEFVAILKDMTDRFESGGVRRIE